MTFTPELINEPEPLALFNPNNTREGFKAHHTVDGEAATAVRRLHDKGLIDRLDGGYLTNLGLNAVEQAQDLLIILKG